MCNRSISEKKTLESNFKWKTIILKMNAHNKKIKGVWTENIKNF